ncbi:hypothetical protein RHOSPDRAFT_34554 [Rhodotorula sp. JG-1b]|nr:hypothetical protein RHOSPDRAFT_34554 [Rhodotorula sp. JG-1b]
MSMLPNPLLPDQLPKPQFRCVIPCGYGLDLFPLVEPESRPPPPPQDQHAGDDKAHHQHQIKPLLPVAGKRMIDWVLDRVQQAGVFEILVLAPESIAKPTSHHLRARRLAAASSSQAAATTTTAQPNARVELEEVPEEVASKNVVRVLMWAIEQNLITTDFILLPCDLLLSPSNNLAAPPISLAALLDRHRSDDNLLTTLFSERAAGNVIEARKDGPPEILTIYDRKSSTLLDVREMDDYDDDEISLRTSLLARYPSPTLTTSLLPTQLYIYSSHVLSILTSPLHARRLRHIEDLQTLAGWLSRQSWRHAHQSLPASETGAVVVKEEPPLAMGRSTTQRPPVSSGSRHYLDARRRTAATGGGVGVETPEIGRGGGGGGISEPPSGFATGANTPALVSRNSYGAIASSPTTTTPIGGGAETSLAPGGGGGGGGAGVVEAAAGPRTGLTARKPTTTRAGAGGCKVVVWRQGDGFAARGNSVAGFVEINRAALKLLPPGPPPTNTPPGVFISPDSHLHLSVYPHLGEKVGLKRCIVGKNTRVGKGSKLTNCVVMENVVIGENVKLDNCVVSNGVQIRDRASLKDCEIGRDVIVDFDSQVKGEQLVVEED